MDIPVVVCMWRHINYGVNILSASNPTKMEVCETQHLELFAQFASQGGDMTLSRTPPTSDTQRTLSRRWKIPAARAPVLERQEQTMKNMNPMKLVIPLHCIS